MSINAIIAILVYSRLPQHRPAGRHYLARAADKKTPAARRRRSRIFSTNQHQRTARRVCLRLHSLRHTTVQGPEAGSSRGAAQPQPGCPVGPGPAANAATGLARRLQHVLQAAWSGRRLRVHSPPRRPTPHTTRQSEIERPARVLSHDSGRSCRRIAQATVNKRGVTHFSRA